MTDFYSTKDPNLEIKHGKKYICIDDWDNIFIAEYFAEQDLFRINIEADHGDYVVNFIFDENIGYYYCSEPLFCFHPESSGGVMDLRNPYRDNKILKVLEFSFKTKGIKL